MIFLASLSLFTRSSGDKSLPSDEELEEDEVDGWRARDLLGGDNGVGEAFGISSFCESWFSVEGKMLSSPLRLCVVLPPFLKPLCDVVGNRACFSCSSASIARNLLSSCSSSVFWIVIEVRLLKERFSGVYKGKESRSHFREISCDRVSRLPPIRKTLSSVAENDLAIVLAPY